MTETTISKRLDEIEKEIDNIEFQLIVAWLAIAGLFILIAW